jgi:calcium-dependent protein kinase
MHTEAGKFKSIVGTPFYVAPEVLEGCYDYRCDIWSIGVMFYFMLTKTNPFYSDEEHKIYEYILKKEIKYTGAVWKGVPEEAKDLCKQLLQRDPNERVTLVNAINHPFFLNEH